MSTGGSVLWFLCHLTCRNLCCIADLVYLEPFLTLAPCNLSSMDWATDGYEQLLMMDDCTSLLHKNNNIPAHQPNQSNSRNVVASGLWDSHGRPLLGSRQQQHELQLQCYNAAASL